MRSLSKEDSEALIRSTKDRANYGRVPALSKPDGVPILFAKMVGVSRQAPNLPDTHPSLWVNEAPSVLGSHTHACLAYVQIWTMTRQEGVLGPE